MRWALGVLWMTACGPLYRPPAPFVPLLEEDGDTNVAIQLGSGGMQADVARAAGDDLAVRGGAQYGGWATRSNYLLGRLGVGAYGAGTGGGRWGLTLEGGAGRVVGVRERLTEPEGTITADGEVDIELFPTETVRDEGTVYVVALRPEVGVEKELFAFGATLGVNYHRFLHDADSDGSGVSQGVSFEPTSVLRFGEPPVCGQAWLGFAFPLWAQTPPSAPPPINLGMGLTVDLPSAYRNAP